MNRSATTVVERQAERSDLPAFEDLLADGSFHARLAKARAARERSLAAGAGDDAEILKRRKPWERAVPPLPRKRTESGAARKEPLVLTAPIHADPRPMADRYIAEPRQVSAEQPALSKTAPVPETRPRGAAFLAAGFGIGLAIGAVATVSVIALSGPKQADDPAILADMPPPAAVASPTVADAEPPGAPDLPETAPDLGASPSGETVLALAAPVTRPAEPSKTLGPVPVARPVVPADSGTRDDVAPPRPAASLPKPQIGGIAALRPLAPEADRAAPLRIVSRPVATPARPGVVVARLPGAPMPDAPLAAQPDPAPFVAPLARPDPAVTVAAAAAAPTVFVGAPALVAEETLADVTARIERAGFATGEPSRVGFSISQSNVRYFHAEDAAAAHRLAGEIDAVARDFTAYSPLPPQGTIEIWIAGSGQGAARKTAPARSPAAPDQQLMRLRDLILRQMRNGDHL